MIRGATEVTPRSLDAAAADLANHVGQPPHVVREYLNAEVLALTESARLKDFIAILAIKNVKELLLSKMS